MLKKQAALADQSSDGYGAPAAGAFEDLYQPPPRPVGTKRGSPEKRSLGEAVLAGTSDVSPEELAQRQESAEFQKVLRQKSDQAAAFKARLAAKVAEREKEGPPYQRAADEPVSHEPVAIGASMSPERSATVHADEPIEAETSLTVTGARDEIDVPAPH